MSARTLVFNLNLAVSQTTGKTERELRDLAESYAQACSQVNERLARCVLYLRQGYRSEAIRLSEIEPNLLDQVHELEFPARSNWVEVARSIGISTPALSMDLAVELMDAYEAHEQTSTLAATLRLLNALRRPASERIVVLQRLLELEPYNVVWQDNLKELA